MPEVAVADREQGLGEAEVARVGEARLDQAPRVDREPLRSSGSTPGMRTGAWESFIAPSALVRGPAPEVRDDEVGAGGEQCLRARPRGRRRRPARSRPARPAATPEMASSTTATCAVGTPSSSAAWTKVSGAGLPGRLSARRDRAVDHDLEPVGQARGGEHRSAFRELDTTASGTPSARELVEQRDRSGVGDDALAREQPVEDHVLRVAEAAHGVGVGRVDGVALGQLRRRGRRGSPGRRRSGVLPSTWAK